MTIEQEVAAVCGTSECVASAGDTCRALDNMASAIVRTVASDNSLVMLCVMNGGLMVAAELLKRISVDLTFDYIHATRYRDRNIGGSIEWRAVPARSLAGQQVVVVDDIFDEGWTLAAIVDYCVAQGARSVTSVVLVDKRHERKVPGFRPDVIGMVLPDRYLYGFGMDYKGYLRNRPAIYALQDQGCSEAGD